MKKIATLLSLLICLACPVLAQQSGTTTAAAIPGQSPDQPPPGGGHRGGGMGMLTPEERQEMKAARDTALQADPTLDAEGKDLMEKMKEHQKKVDAAMIKADPAVAPLIAKMEAARQRHDGQGAPPPPPGN